MNEDEENRTIAKSYVYNSEGRRVAELRTLHLPSLEVWRIVVFVTGVEPALGPPDLVIFDRYDECSALFTHVCASEGLRPAGGRIEDRV